MNLLDEQFFLKLKKQRNTYLAIFLVLSLIFIIGYGLSFLTNILAVSLAVGIIGIIALVLFYCGLILDKNKLLILYNNINTGITQKDEYTFKRFDDETEHDGVKLIRIICSFTDENEEFERTLYFLTALKYPELKENQIIKVTTHQNIIINIED